MIHEIRIQNFKSVQDVTVEFAPVTILVGRSGTGKSNFVDAIRFLRDSLCGQANGFAAAFAGMGGASTASLDSVRPLPKTDAPTRFEICFSVRSESEKYRYVLELGSTQTNRRLGEEKLSLGETVLFHQVADEWTFRGHTTSDLSGTHHYLSGKWTFRGHTTRDIPFGDTPLSYLSGTHHYREPLWDLSILPPPVGEVSPNVSPERPFRGHTTSFSGTHH